MKNKKTRKEKAYIFLNKQHLDEIWKKNQANAKEYLETEILLFEDYSHSSSTWSFRIIGK